MLVVGSDCSGMCTESQPLDALGTAHVHAFSSEVCGPAGHPRHSRHGSAAEGDVTEREVERVPTMCDLVLLEVVAF